MEHDLPPSCFKKQNRTPGPNQNGYGVATKMGRERDIQDKDALGTHAKNLCSELGRGESSWKSSAIETFILEGLCGS